MIEYAEGIEPAPDPETGVPYCSTECSSYDGKRCRMMGMRPGHICEPAAEAIIAELAALKMREPIATTREEALREAEEAAVAAIRGACDSYVAMYPSDFVGPVVDAIEALIASHTGESGTK